MEEDTVMDKKGINLYHWEELKVPSYDKHKTSTPSTIPRKNALSGEFKSFPQARWVLLIDITGECQKYLQGVWTDAIHKLEIAKTNKEISDLYSKMVFKNERTYKAIFVYLTPAVYDQTLTMVANLREFEARYMITPATICALGKVFYLRVFS